MPLDPLMPLPPVEDMAKQMFAQRAQQTMQQAAADSAAFHQQLAQTKYARAHAQMVQLPKNQAYGMDEQGNPIRDAKPTGRVWMGSNQPSPTDSAENISKYGARAEDFKGMGIKDVADTVDMLPTQMGQADLDHAAAQRGAAHGRAGTLPAFIPADAVLSESADWSMADPRVPVAGGRVATVHREPATPGVYAGAPTAGQPVPGTAAHPVERMFGHLDDTVAQGGYEALLAAHPDNPISALAKQLEVQRMRQMGMWDPTFADGGSY